MLNFQTVALRSALLASALLLLAWPCCAVRAATATESATGRKAQEKENTARGKPASGLAPLDQQLLDSLENDLLSEGSDDAESPSGSDRAPRRAPGVETPAIDGEDLGSEKENPVERIGQQMRTAGELMEKDHAPENTSRLHTQIVEDLGKLIAELEKQCSGGDCQQSPLSQQPSAAQKSSKPAGQSAAASGRPGTAPASESNPQSRDKSGQPGTLASIQGLIKEVWGQLPERARQQLLQSPPEQFLPQYQELIEQYYRRLAEEREPSR